MRSYADLLTQLHSHQFFDDMVKDLLSLRPVVPAHDAKSDNTEDWKAKSAQQQGFDLCLAFFKIK